MEYLNCKLHQPVRGTSGFRGTRMGHFWRREFNVKRTSSSLPKSFAIYLATVLGLLMAPLALSQPTARHPGPLGAFGDFLQDTPGAVFVLALIIWGISNARKK